MQEKPTWRCPWQKAILLAILLQLSNVGRANEEGFLRVGAAAVNLQADDSMEMAGMAGRPFAQGQEGELRVVAVVLAKSGNPSLAIVSCDVLWIPRELSDRALAVAAKSTGIPASNILVHATHTHHAPSPAAAHDFGVSQLFRQRLHDGLVKAIEQANSKLSPASARFFFHLGQENTVGANSRLLLDDGTVTWINPVKESAGKGKPTGPFDPQLPVLDFRTPDNKTIALLYNHSTHTIGTRSGKNVRSASFYGLAAQDLEPEFGGVIGFLEGASGSTHNIHGVPVAEATERIKQAIRSARTAACPRPVHRLAAIRRTIPFTVRHFDDAEEEKKIVKYATKHTPAYVDYWRSLFGKMRDQLRSQQGAARETYVQTLLVGDVAIVGVPGEYFTSLGVAIKKRSPFERTYVAELANDWIGYLPDREGHRLGGYQTWMGLHSYAEVGMGERIAEEALAQLNELAGKNAKPTESKP